ncbi:Loki-CTERM sorting domain-containing protein [Promethearchaeum syntrophicum]|uniref:Loki-CTERM sorting domain-containing protein n=1 Tax=Promethearchaeum syntrophicum TaxID=2594042 RepID=A0A5B9DB07_9ARCH|nr:Loki-CTERM sorting domain-containing protein [Candidatus Prometheoarchaeum syntrophicum]QEE16302.1 hypothetical protein DSAG12_02132 [Candidatus Prometheoarchaeum syntrophicum]
MNDKNQNFIKTLGLIALISLIFAQSNFMRITPLNNLSPDKDSHSILKMPVVATYTYSAPIAIDGNSELTSFIADKEFSGEGTSTSPYFIENCSIFASSTNGIDIRNTDAHLIIRNCRISGGSSGEHDGIYFQRSSNITITNNTMINNYWGIFLRYSPNNIISHNFVNNSYSFGITCYSGSDNCLILENNVSHCDWGITITDSDNSVISENNLTFNGDAVYLNNHCENCTISENSITNNTVGVNLYADCCSNTIFGNNLRYNYRLGIEIDNDCNNNLVYFNDVCGNVKGQAEELHESLNNQWDNGSVGNYWGDYQEKYPKARNNSVFWRTPYEIDGSDLGVDHYPLVRSILEYDSIKGIKIPGFPLVNMIFFISIGAILLRKRIRNQLFRK